MNYEYLTTLPNGKERYKVTLNVYRDCFQSDVPLDDNIPLGVYLNDNDLNIYETVTFGLVFQGNVDPPGSVDCDYYAKNVCIEFGLYEGFIDLPPFAGGYHLTFVRCCRNIQDNLPENGSTPYQGQTYYCYIPNTAYNNSSPVFSGVPSPFMCAKDTTTFLFNAIDPDGDELSYKLVRPFQGGSATINGSLPDPPDNLTLPIKPVDYTAGFSFTKPFGNSNGSISTVDPVTGLTTFLSPNTGSYVVGIEVTESRIINGNKVVLSTIRMDLQILVLDCPPNKRPTLSSTASGKTLQIEAGAKLCFDVTGTDPDGDNVKLTADGPVLTGDNGFIGTRATFQEKTGLGTVTSEFCWDTDCEHARDEPYLFTVTVEDDGCPPKFNYLDFQIIVKPFIGADEITGPDPVCRYNTAKYNAIGGATTSSFEWEISEGSIIGATNEDEIIVDWDGTGTGKVRMREISEHGCIGEWAEKNVVIRESPALPVITGKDTVCLNESPLLYVVGFNSGNTYEWFADNATFGTVIGNDASIASYNPPNFTLKVVETNSTGCSSDTAYKEVFVSDPNPTFTGPTTVCPNAEDIQYIADSNPGSTYDWTVVGGNQVSGGNSNQIGIDWGDPGLGSVSVTETNKFGCISPPVTVNVNKTYNLIVNDVIGPTDVCEFDLGVEYSTLEVSGSKFIWNIVGGNQASGDSTSAITIDWGVAGSGIVSMREIAWDNVNGRTCLSDEFQLNVTIHPKPTADEIVGIMEVCQFDDSVSYSVSGMPGSTYEWSIDGNTDGIVGQGTNEIKIFWDVDGSFTLAVTETSIQNCPGGIIDTLVLVNPRPVTSPINGEFVICPEDALGKVYDVTGFATSQYNWTVGGANSVSGDGTNSIVVDWETSIPQGILSVVEISDKGCPGDTQYAQVEIDRLDIDLRYVSVGTPDDRMYINWQMEEIATTDQFEIQKYDPITATWSTIATVGGNTLNYLELGINTDDASITYRIRSENKCGYEVLSEEHTSILLEGYQDEDFDINLKFSDYLGWDNGVESYEIFESINNGPYYPKANGILPNQNFEIINDPDQYRKCYRVQAKELDGEKTTSWSNEICFFFSPTIYVPNAITVNGDGINDAFGVVGLAINEYNIKIYNRWGERLYESTNIEDKWQPVYQDKPVQMGTYVYVITYTDFENKAYTKTGTINLIR